MKNIITIGREFGSGGREIGEKLSQRLGIPFYDKKLISVASKLSGMSENVFYQNDESQSGSFIYSLLMGTYSVGEGGLIYPEMPISHKVFLAQFDAIKTIAEEGPCVIVGRCADYVLKEYDNVLKIFITASLKSRKERAISSYGISTEKADDYVKKMDKKRGGYYKFYTGAKWGEAANFDLCINSSTLGIDNTVELLLDYVKYRQSDK